MTEVIIALEKDLFFAVKMRDTLRHYDIAVTTVRNLATFEQSFASEEGRPILAIVNISTPGIDWEAAIRSANAHNVPVLAFGSHIDIEAQQRARQAGARRVVANSKFVKDMPGLVQRTLQTPVQTQPISDEDEDEDMHDDE